MRKYLLSAAAVSAVVAGTTSAQADMAAAERWIDSEFQPSAISRADQSSEMQWFIDAAKPYNGMEINVISEGIPTHSYESEVLTKAFEEITSILFFFIILYSSLVILNSKTGLSIISFGFL